MNAWKSPLLYLGVLLIGLVAVAFIVPFFINWNSYRDALEFYGSGVTGRKVTISGDIKVRLFPRPVMTVKDVRIANPVGAVTANLVKAQSLRLQLNPGSLLSGTFDFEAIEVEKPVIALERLTDGTGSWELNPGSTNKQWQLGKGRVTQIDITLHDGSVILGDAKRSGVAPIAKFNSHISAPALLGPWKLNGQADYKGAPLNITLATGKIQTGQPVKFSVRLSPDDAEGLIYNFNGQTGGKDNKVTGFLRIKPGVRKNGTASAETGVRPLVLRSKIKADFNHVVFDELEITPLNGVDIANSFTGSAKLQLGQTMRLQTNLSASKIDTASFLGIQGRGFLHTPRQLLPMLAQITDNLPDNVEWAASTEITDLKIDDKNYGNNQLDFLLANEQLKINRLRSVIPGQAQVEFSGLFVTAKSLPQLSGQVKFDTHSLRDFARTIWPEKTQAIAQSWTGNRGRLTLSAMLDLSPDSILISDIDAVGDAMKASGIIAINDGETSSISARIKTDQFDLDRYLPNGIRLGDGAAKNSVAGLDIITGMMTSGDVQLDFSADKMRLNGVEAQNVAFDLGVRDDGLNMRKLQLTTAGGAKLSLNGAIGFPDEVIAGAMSGKITANKPVELLRFFLLVDKDITPKWVTALGRLTANFNAHARNEDDKATIDFNLDSVADAGTATLKGSFNGPIKAWRDGAITANLVAKSPSLHQFIAVTGGGITSANATAAPSVAAGLADPVILQANLAGQLRGGVVSSVILSHDNAEVQFSGLVQDEGSGIKTKGRLALLAQKGQQLMSDLGLPALNQQYGAQVIAVESQASYNGKVLALNKITGSLAGSSLSGELVVKMGEKRPVLSGKIASGEVSLPWLLNVWLMPSRNNDLARSNRFLTTAQRFDIAGLDITSERSELVPGYTAGAGKIQLSAVDDVVDITGISASQRGKEISFKLHSAGQPQGRKFTGKIRFETNSDDVLRSEDGKHILAGNMRLKLDFNAQGLSPSAALSAVQGMGDYQIKQVKLYNINPAGFAAGLASAQNGEDIDKLISQKLVRGDMSLPNMTGSVKIAMGNAAFSPQNITNDTVSGTLNGSFNIAEYVARLVVRLSLLKADDLPPFTIKYSGYPNVMRQDNDFADFKAKLTMRAMEQGLEKLNRLQEEQHRLLEEEKKFRQQQIEKRQTMEKARRLEAERQQKAIQAAAEKKRAKAEAEKRARQGRAEDKAKAARSKTVAPGGLIIDPQPRLLPPLPDVIEIAPLPDLPTVQ